MTAPDQAGTAEPPWWERRTLRFRVLASLLLVMIAAFALVGVVTLLALNRFLVNHLDQQLRASGGRYAATVDDHDGDSDDPITPPTSDPDGFGDSRGQAVGTLGVRIVRNQLHGVGIVGAASAPVVSATAARAIESVPLNHPRSVDLGALGDYRLLASPLPDGDRVVIGLPLHPVHDTIAELLVVELVVFGAVLLATAAIGGGLIGVSLRPLARVTVTARKVTESPLTDGDSGLPHRVEASDPKTEVGQLGVAFNHMLDHVESSLATRQQTEARLRQFIADASHELRTPVASIRGHAESVRHGPDDVPETVLVALRRIESEATRMGVLVDELLLLARLDAGRPLEAAPVDLTRIAIDATNDARVAARDHQWSLDLPAKPVVVVGDDHRLHEVVANLLTNAAVHTPAGTQVRLSLVTDAPSESAVLTVSDDGPGIAKAAQSHVFERFYRAERGRPSSTGSSGLGLAIVSAVTTAHGGSVALASQPGMTTFTIRLPLGFAPG